MALAFMALVAQAAERPEVTAEKVQAALSELEKLAEQAMQKTGIPGMAIAVVYKDKVVYLKGFGVREAGKPETVDADTVFQLASVSKAIASTVVAALVGEKVVSWDDPIIKRDPGFQMYDSWVTREVTLRDMFAHRSGLPDGKQVIDAEALAETHRPQMASYIAKDPATDRTDFARGNQQELLRPGAERKD